MQSGTKEADAASGLRVVLDTNVYVSAFTHPEGKLSAVWMMAKSKRYQLIISPVILREVARTLRRVFGWEEQAILGRLRHLVRVGLLVTPTQIPDAIPEDPADNHILACAVEGKADLIVSGDKDLLRLGAYAGIPIVRPMDFLRTLGAEHNS